MPWDDAEILGRLGELESGSGNRFIPTPRDGRLRRAHAALKRPCCGRRLCPALKALAIYYLHRAQLGQGPPPVSGG